MGSLATAKKKVKAEEGFDLADVLSSATAPKESKSKSKVPLLTVSEDVKKNAAKIREVKEELDSLESMYENLSAELIEKVSPLRENLCRQGYVSSVRIPDNKGLSVSLSWADKYSKINAANEKELKEIAGDRFDDYFAKDLVITVKDISEESLKEIVKAVGPERFSQFFTVEKSFKPNSRFNQEQFTAFTPEQRQRLLQAGVKQNKPSVKVK
jgi:hypothetical protein